MTAPHSNSNCDSSREGLQQRGLTAERAYSREGSYIIAGLASDAQFDVLCVMGAVKDASSEEISMVAQGCAQLGLQLRSCNLGRSAQVLSAHRLEL